MWPHFLLRQLVARGGRRACLIISSLVRVYDRIIDRVCDETYVALAADVLLAVVLGSEGLEGRLNDTTTETEDQVKGGLL